MRITRREFIRQSAAATGGAAAGIPLPVGCEHRHRFRMHPDEVVEGAVPLLRHRLRRHVAVKDGRVVATHGDTRPRSTAA